MKMMMVRSVLLSSLLVAAGQLLAMEKQSLDGLWDFRFEERKSLEEVGNPRFEANDKMTVPGCWDAMSHYYNKRGTGLYRRTFECGAKTSARLVVEGMCLRARFWLDGRDLGLVKLPWSRFTIDLGTLSAGRHELVAAVDSMSDDEKVKLFRDFYDFYAFGGFHHGVWLESTDKTSDFSRVVVRTRDYKTGEVELQLEPVAGLKTPLDGAMEVSFDGAPARTVDFRGGRARVRVPGFRLWTPETPNLHRVSVRAGEAEASARFGIRQVGTAAKRITLNGKPVYIKGVNRHEAHYEFGATTPVQLMYEDIRNLKDLGGNFIRGAHYAQCEAFLDLCDELGVLVWEESLGWGNRKEQFPDPEFRALQEEETRLMVRNSINHPSIVISGFLNEPQSKYEECRTLVDRLIDVIRTEDTGHLVTFACNDWPEDICHAKTDIIAYNAYPCWYTDHLMTGLPEELRAKIRDSQERIVKTFRERYKDDRPILISEMGVKADYGVRDPRGKAQYTEDFQDEYERVMLEEVFAMKELCGIAIWQFTDAKTYTRTIGMVGRSYGVNTGGLYDLYRRPKLVVESVRELFKKGPEQ